MPKVSPEHLRDRRDAIVQAARTVFAENGFDGTSIGEIARVAGTSDGLIYRYFNGKRELLSATLESFYAEIQAEIAAAIAAHSGYRAKLASLIEQHIRVFAEDPGICRLFISEVRNMEAYVGSTAQALNRSYTALLTPILEVGVAEGAIAADIDRRLVRDMLFGGIEHIAWRHISTGTVIDIPKVASIVTATFLGGLSIL
jgi:AcrR family transcriptional regulator